MGQGFSTEDSRIPKEHSHVRHYNQGIFDEVEREVSVYTFPLCM